MAITKKINEKNKLIELLKNIPHSDKENEETLTIKIIVDNDTRIIKNIPKRYELPCNLKSSVLKKEFMEKLNFIFLGEETELYDYQNKRKEVGQPDFMIKPKILNDVSIVQEHKVKGDSIRESQEDYLFNHTDEVGMFIYVDKFYTKNEYKNVLLTYDNIIYQLDNFSKKQPYRHPKTNNPYIELYQDDWPDNTKDRTMVGGGIVVLGKVIYHSGNGYLIRSSFNDIPYDDHKGVPITQREIDIIKLEIKDIIHQQQQLVYSRRKKDV